MAYLGLARKWRPQTFDDLVGQSHIARTISNAIKSDKVSHGYIFTGTRGIGKTSTARIFAKALRCQTPVQVGIPCGKCSDCTEIADGKSIDVLEIDGASNNGVDAIREIRENAKFLPSSGKYKIYIIDEVHMLTTAAFNALLKTLEEPPAHVIFVFATTDPQKIPATVHSRCQRFDFKRVSLKDLAGRLKFICEQEKVEITTDAIAIIAREAEGSMRDAISLLDQIFSIGSEKITAENITASLGLVDKQTILEGLTGILKRKPLDALDAVGRVYLHGLDLKSFGRELLRLIRQLMVAKLLNQRGGNDLSQYIDISDVDQEDLKHLFDDRSIEDLSMLFRMLSHGLEDVAKSPLPKMVMDVLIIKMCTVDDLIPVTEVATTDFSAQTPRATTVAPVQQQHAPAQTTVTPAPTAKPISPAAGILAQLANRSSSPNVSSDSKSTSQNFRTSSMLKAPITTPQPAANTPAPAITAAQQSNGAALTLATASHDTLTTWWAKVVAQIRTQKPMVGSILEHMGIESIRDENQIASITLTYAKDHSFYRDQLQSRAYTDLVSQLLKNHLGRAVRLEYKEVFSSTSIEAIAEEKQRVQAEQQRRAVLDSEAMKAAQQLLGARIEKLEIAPQIEGI